MNPRFAINNTVKDYKEWNTEMLFRRWLEMDIQEELDPLDWEEFEKVTQAILGKPLQEKYSFSKTLGSKNQGYFKESFLIR